MFTFPVEEFTIPTSPDPPVTFPITFTIPFEVTTIDRFDAIPAVAFPYKFKIPVVVTTIVSVDPDPAEDDRFPYTFKIPEPLCIIALLLQFPMTFSVPLEPIVVSIASEFAPTPPFKLPIIVAVAGDIKPKATDPVGVPEALIFAVRVTPLESWNIPVPEMLIVVTVTLWLIVTVWPVEARASSAGPGTIPPTHVDPVLKFPVAAERMSAIA